MAQFDLSNLRFLQTTETDHKSPGDEALMVAIRQLIEALFWLLLGVDKGTLTSDPPDDTTGFLIDTAAGFANDEHNDRTVMILDGNDVLGFYEINDTEAANNRIECAGENFYAKGIRSGNAYMILGDVINATAGHRHNNVDSMKIVASIDQAALKTTTGSVSNATSAWTNNVLPGGSYGFRESIYMTSSTSQVWGATIAYHGAAVAFAGWTAASTVIQLLGASPYAIAAQQRYVQSSGEVHWIFILRDKITGAIKRIWESSDHPCFGNGNKPKLCPHPFPDFDPATEEIVVINPSKEEVLDMRKATIVEADDQPNRSLLAVIGQEYEIDETSEPKWPNVPVTVGLPEDWEEAWLERRRVTPTKMVIPQPKEVLVKSLKKKAVGKVEVL